MSEYRFASQAAWYRMENGPKSKNGKKIGKKIENGRRPEIGKKMAQKWRKNGIRGHFSIFSAFLGHFFPEMPRAIFYFLANLFSFSDFGPFSILYQAA